MNAEEKMIRMRAERLGNEGDELRKQKEFEKALAKYSEGIESDPTYDWNYIGKALVYSALDDEQKGEKVLLDALGQHVETARLLEYLADRLRYQDRNTDALECYQRALKMENDRPFCWAGMAWVCLKQDKDKEAKEFSEKALAISPKNSWACECLGKIAEKHGDLEEALRYYQAGELNAAIERMRSKIAARDSWNELPTVKEMLAYLDRFVCGQKQSKIDLATAIYNHYLSLSYQDDNIVNADLGRFNIILFGPSGCGKTYMAELLTKKLGVPLAIISATSLVQTGYVGKKVDSIVEDLLVAAEFNVQKAERGIIFIDEIDKVRCNGGSGPDVSGEGVQNALLTLLEGRLVRTVFEGRGAYNVNTAKVLFICTGAFDGLADIVKARLKRQGGSIGFASAVHKESNRSDSELLQQVTAQDFETYGMIGQLVGRFATVSNLRVLTREDLRHILIAMENSVLKKQSKLFELHGISLKFDTQAIEAMLDLVNSERTGARGLRQAIGKALQGVAWKVDQLAADGVIEVRITEATVKNGAEPEVKKRAESAADDEPIAARLRKSAFASPAERTPAKS